MFPFGRREVPPSDRLGRRVAALMTAPNEARDRLTAGIYKTPNPNNPVGRMNALLPDVILAEPVERKFLKAAKAGELKGYDYATQLADARGERRAERRRVRVAKTRSRCVVRVHLGRRFRFGRSAGGPAAATGVAVGGLSFPVSRTIPLSRSRARGI